MTGSLRISRGRGGFLRGIRLEGFFFIGVCHVKQLVRGWKVWSGVIGVGGMCVRDVLS